MTGPILALRALAFFLGIIVFACLWAYVAQLLVVTRGA